MKEYAFKIQNKTVHFIHTTRLLNIFSNSIKLNTTMQFETKTMDNVNNVKYISTMQLHRFQQYHCCIDLNNVSFNNEKFHNIRKMN